MIRQTDCHQPPTAPDQPLIALAFDRKGQLLAKGEIDEGVAHFKLKPAELRSSRVFVLPEPDDGLPLESLSLEQIADLTTFEPRLNLTDDGGVRLGIIPESLTEIWLWKRCCVRGRITNRASVEGSLETYPVCNATVHICEVDRIRFWIERIPEDLLDRLRYGLIERIPVPQPPVPDPRFNRVLLNPQPLPPVALNRPVGAAGLELQSGSGLSLGLDEVAFNPQPDPPRDWANSLDLGRLQSLQVQLPSLRSADFRQLLVDEFQLFRPYFCYFPYLWPYLYRCDEVAVVQTDNNGRYEACFWYQESAPDVYIWIEYPFATGIETVYRPHLACYTRWDYACGSDFNVQLHNNRIPPVCGVGLVGTSVAIRAIGHSVSPLAIEQTFNRTIPVPGNANFRTVGLTNYATGGLGSYSPLLTGQHLRPYLGTFPLIAQFGSALPAAGIHYFQVRYRQVHSPTLVGPGTPSAAWKTLHSGGLSRTHVRPDGLDFKYGSYSLGPLTVGGEEVYRIPPFDPQDPGVDGVPPSTEPLARWTQYDRVAIGQVNANALDGDGLYEFQIRFLNESGNPAAVGPEFFRVPDPTDASETMAAPEDYILTDGGASSFRFKLRIDTSAPDMAIEGVSLDGDPDAMTDCGFVEYANLSQQVGLTFTAAHPQDFALFQFDLERGRRLATTNHFALGDAQGMVSGSKTPYTLGPDGKYRANFSVNDLLAGCGGKAAFSEVLTVRGLHTDGHQAGNFFARSISNSFALAPE
ncbi:hypothetical protein QWY85_19230 [Neolewinella lacunae]|uniref:Uncharacterized protein n=1 Tax=Neolewinella lacunae TaxID=1517758 RepID=A0A923PNF9_9BACT|nr:hypothetical protein [Neolewinella lacunae]MBC6994891.1 hypothetical protein [Neolewinella lacunae]MDN3636811.1 hypothetical protein [Neolewinella lacunae]